MDNSDHTSRTLLMSDKQPGILIVSRGSSDNIDPRAQYLSSGHAQIRAFNVSNFTSDSDPYEFSTTGRLLGWGLRNSVGLAEEPLTGGIYSVENSADEVRRDGKDVHQDNPGEELNFHGYLNSSTEHQGGNYGYPNCLAVWGLALIQSAGNADGLTVGSQFVQKPNSTFNDTTCAKERVAPRLTFQAHMAPLDIIFEPDGSMAYVSFHGSWYVFLPLSNTAI
jgi:glucose/arabinose dehydrogenase